MASEGISGGQGSGSGLLKAVLDLLLDLKFWQAALALAAAIRRAASRTEDGEAGSPDLACPGESSEPQRADEGAGE